MDSECAIAVMDLGSQTFRVAGARVASNRVDPIFSLRENVRLGQGLNRSGRLSGVAIERAVKALKNFLATLQTHNIKRYKAVGTAALREAKNSNEFLDRATKLGVHVEVISPQQEAALSVRGAYLTLPDIDDPWVMVDVGGGSSEVTLNRGERPEEIVSLGIGAVSLTEAVALGGGLKGLSRLKDHVSSMIHKGLGQQRAAFSATSHLVATGGTATTIAAVVLAMETYDPLKVRGLTLGRLQLEEILNKVASMPLDQRRALAGLEPERADIFPAGIAILLGIVSYLGLKEVIISDGGILLGLLAAFIEKECGVYVKPSSARGLYV